MISSSNSVDLKQAIGQLEALPAMPVVAQKLLALRLDTVQGERELLLLIEQDPMLSAKIIGLANSPLVSSTRKPGTVRDAAMLLGMARVRSVATSIAIMSRMSKLPDNHFNVHDLWLHSLGIAFSMLVLAKAMPEGQRPQEDRVFLVGMLHDIGYLALAHLDPARSDSLHKRLIIEPSRALPEIEQQLLGIGHGELGAILVQHWNLPEEIVGVLRFHHAPQTATPGVTRQLAYMVNLAEKLLVSFGFKERVAAGITDIDWKVLGIDPERAEEIASEVASQAEQATLFVAGSA